MRRHVAQVDIEFVFPQQFSGVDIEAHDTFLLRRALAGGALQVNVITHDDWSGATTVRRSPREVLTCGRPFHWQVLFVGDPVASWTAPFVPIAEGKDG